MSSFDLSLLSPYLGLDTSNEIKYSLSADNYPDVARINTNKHNWSNQTTSCYPNFPVTKFNFKAIKNVFNSCDPLKNSFCSASHGNLASKKNGDFRNTCHDLSCFQSRQHDSHFKYEHSQPLKDNYLQNNCVQNGANIADFPNVGGFLTNKRKLDKCLVRDASGMRRVRKFKLSWIGPIELFNVQLLITI